MLQMWSVLASTSGKTCVIVLETTLGLFVYLDLRNSWSCTEM